MNAVEHESVTSDIVTKECLLILRLYYRIYSLIRNRNSLR